MSDEASSSFSSSSAPGGDGALDAEILRHALRVAAEEASIVVVKSAHSAMIVEGADACAGILDARARLVAEGEDLLGATAWYSDRRAMWEELWQ